MFSLNSLKGMGRKIGKIGMAVGLAATVSGSAGCKKEAQSQAPQMEALNSNQGIVEATRNEVGTNLRAVQPSQAEIDDHIFNLQDDEDALDMDKIEIVEEVKPTGPKPPMSRIKAAKSIKMVQTDCISPRDYVEVIGVDTDGVASLEPLKPCEPTIAVRPKAKAPTAAQPISASGPEKGFDWLRKAYEDDEDKEFSNETTNPEDEGQTSPTSEQIHEGGDLNASPNPSPELTPPVVADNPWGVNTTFDAEWEAMIDTGDFPEEDAIVLVEDTREVKDDAQEDTIVIVKDNEEVNANGITDDELDTLFDDSDSGGSIVTAANVIVPSFDKPSEVEAKLNAEELAKIYNEILLMMAALGLMFYLFNEVIHAILARLREDELNKIFTDILARERARNLELSEQVVAQREIIRVINEIEIPGLIEAHKAGNTMAVSTPPATPENDTDGESFFNAMETYYRELDRKEAEADLEKTQAERARDDFESKERVRAERKARIDRVMDEEDELYEELLRIIYESDMAREAEKRDNVTNIQAPIRNLDQAVNA